MVKNLRIEEFDYPLPDDRIARYPLAQRDSCKLLMRRADGSVSDHVFTELPGLLPMDAMLVYNNTRVINARLRFRKPRRGYNRDFSAWSQWSRAIMLSASPKTGVAHGHAL